MTYYPFFCRGFRSRSRCRRVLLASAMTFAGMLCVAGASNAQVSQRGLDFSGGVSPVTGDLAGTQFYSGSHVLIVGISQYKHLDKSQWLQFADKDARDLRDLLIRSYGFPPSSITMLLNAQATKAHIEAALNSFADDGVNANDRVLIYFSGHGQTVSTGAGGELGFLIPYDAQIDLNRPQNKGGYFSSCIAMDSIWSRLSASSARHALVIADACYGGLLVRPKTLTVEQPSSRVIASLLQRDAREVLTAGGAGETALEDPALGHGAFTYKLLEELRAQAATPDTILMASELAAALKTSVANLTNAHQTPVFGNYGATEGDFIFLTTKPQRVPPPSVATNTSDSDTSPVENNDTNTGKKLPPVSLDLHDAPLRLALEQLFSNAGVQFSIDPAVSGFVTIKVVDVPFDSALRMLLRSSATPFVYTVEGGVYFIKPK